MFVVASYNPLIPTSADVLNMLAGGLVWFLVVALILGLVLWLMAPRKVAEKLWARRRSNGPRTRRSVTPDQPV